MPAPSKGEIHEILPEEPTMTPMTPEYTTIHPTKSSDPLTRCSTCTRVITQAAIDSQDSEHTIEEARKAGMDWATDMETPTGVNSAKVFHTTTDAPMSKLPDPLNYWLPDSYAYAMSRPDIWAEPISKELNVMKTWNICVRVPIFPIVVCVRSAYVIGAGVGFRVESGAVALLQLDL